MRAGGGWAKPPKKAGGERRPPRGVTRNKKHKQVLKDVSECVCANNFLQKDVHELLAERINPERTPGAKVLFTSKLGGLGLREYAQHSPKLAQGCVMQVTVYVMTSAGTITTQHYLYLCS